MPPRLAPRGSITSLACSCTPRDRDQAGRAVLVLAAAELMRFVSRDPVRTSSIRGDPAVSCVLMCLIVSSRNLSFCSPLVSRPCVSSSSHLASHSHRRLPRTVAFETPADHCRNSHYRATPRLPACPRTSPAPSASHPPLRARSNELATHLPSPH